MPNWLLPQTKPCLAYQHQFTLPPASYHFTPPKSDKDMPVRKQYQKHHAGHQVLFEIWKEWTKHTLHTTGILICPLVEITCKEKWDRLSKFIVEVRKRKGKVYPPKTLHHIVRGLMRHLRWNGRPDIDFFKDLNFSNSQAVEMEKLQRQGEGFNKKQADVLTEEKNISWEEVYLGYATPQSLLDAMVFTMVCTSL